MKKKKSNVVIFSPFFPAPAVKTNPSAPEKTIGKRNTKVVWSNAIFLSYPKCHRHRGSIVISWQTVTVSQFPVFQTNP